MLESREERVILLKAGFKGKDIEKLYVILNDFKLVDKNILFAGEW